MFTTLILLAAATVTQAPKSPKPIDKTRYEEISQAMLRLQATQLALMQARQESDKAIGDWSKLLESLRKEYDADGCQPTFEKTWDCREREAKAQTEAKK